MNRPPRDAGLTLAVVLAAAVAAAGLGSSEALGADPTGPADDAAKATSVPAGHDLADFPVLLPSAAASAIEVHAETIPAEAGSETRFAIYRGHDAPRRRPHAAVVLLDAAPEGVRLDGPRPRADSRARLAAVEGLHAVVLLSDTARRSRDLATLFAHLAANGRKHGVDAERLGVWLDGDDLASTGAALLAPGGPPLGGAVLFYGAAEIDATTLDVPLFWVRAGRDRADTNRAVDAFAREALTAGAPVTVVSHPHGQRGFDVADDTPETRRIVRAALAFLRERLAGDAGGRPAGRAQTTPAPAGAKLSPSGAKLSPLLRATAYYESHAWGAAADAYLVHTWESPDDAVAQLRLGESSVRAGRYRQALPALARASDLGYRVDRATYLAAAAQAGLGEVELSVENLRRSSLNDPHAVARALTDPAFDRVRALDPFHAIVREHAPRGSARIAAAGAAGAPLEIEIALSRDGRPLRDALVYLEHANPDGDSSGPFGYARADDGGRARFRTVLPRGASPSVRCRVTSASLARPWRAEIVLTTESSAGRPGNADLEAPLHRTEDGGFAARVDASLP